MGPLQTVSEGPAVEALDGPYSSLWASGRPDCGRLMDSAESARVL